MSNLSNIPININNLTYYYAKQYGGKYDTPMLSNIKLQVNQGQRLLVVGGNGAGKSTFLRIIAGKHLIDDEAVLIFGRDAFRDTLLNNIRAYVSADWGQRTVAFSGHNLAYSADIAVRDMMKELQSTFPERRNKLLEVLRIDLNWRMHKVSDGQRRRVQLFISLIRPCKLIILDEVLGLLDILARQDFLQYLTDESNINGTTVILATNVFDGLTEWTTDVLYLRQGKQQIYSPINQIPKLLELQKNHCSEPLMRTVEYWLREELKELQNNNKKNNKIIFEKELGPDNPDAPHETYEELKCGAGYSHGRSLQFLKEDN